MATEVVVDGTTKVFRVISVAQHSNYFSETHQNDNEKNETIRDEKKKNLFEQLSLSVQLQGIEIF